jgi:hypothetical protein
MGSKPGRMRVTFGGENRLTPREAVAFLRLVNRGLATWKGVASIAEIRAAENAVEKLKRSMDAGGLYREDGTLIDPFKEAMT